MPSSACQADEVAAGRDLDEIVETTIQKGRLATLPTVTARIIRLSEDPDSTAAELNDVVANDPALGMRVLKLVNSAYYGVPRQVDSIQRASALLGFRAVKNVAIAASLVRLFRGGLVGPEFAAGELWTHSLAVAIAARMLVRLRRPAAADEAFLAGLIHDAGILVEMQSSGPAFARMVQALAADETLTFRRAEERAFGASHEAFGAGLCKAWNLPPSLQLVTGHHHRPWELSPADRTLPAVVHIADLLAARAGLGYTRTVETDGLDAALLDSADLSEADAEQVAQALPAAVADSERLMSEDRA